MCVKVVMVLCTYMDDDHVWKLYYFRGEQPDVNRPRIADRGKVSLKQVSML